MTHELLGLREGPAVNESRNDSVGHPCLSLLVLTVGVEQFFGKNGGLLAHTVKCLESANEPVRVRLQSGRNKRALHAPSRILSLGQSSYSCESPDAEAR